ncbi:diguanylate cyclase [Acidovorax lacteus]|uniref:diguanylate cyclase n=1 Tax=Acidovorax lacteus TaxID=1924988 RepID=UPI0031ECB3FA
MIAGVWVGGSARLWTLCWLLLACGGPAAASPAALELRPTAALQDAWTVATVHFDASGTHTAEQLVAERWRFEAPPHRGGSLGVRTDAVWVRVPLQVSEASATHEWVASLDYGSLREVDFYLIRGSAVVQTVLLGYSRAATDHGLNARTPTMLLQLEPGQSHELLLRVRTHGPMILPLQVATLPQYLLRSLREQMLQGVLQGLALGLIAYSLLQWITQRDRMFGYYAMVVVGSAGFLLQFFSVGGQFLWGQQPWIEQRIAPVCGLIALAGSYLFLRHVLAGHDVQSRYARSMHTGALVTIVAAGGTLAGWVNVPMATAFMSLTGMLPSLLSLPRAWRRVREGDPIGTPLLWAWTAYGAGAGVMVALAQGWVPAQFWSLHAFQFGATIDMLLFLRVLGLRAKAVRDEARLAAQERDAMRVLAHTDPLTGLPNRRGLQGPLSAAMLTATSERPLAVYVLDLDGFKPVNDQHGHDVGDELLEAVARRLSERVRYPDLIARVGGDEFLVLARSLHSAQDAQQLGEQLVAAMEAPFLIGPLSLQLGLTVGYALAPQDAQTAQELVKQADAAMYRGKQDGRFCLRRHTAPAPRQSSVPAVE